MRLFQCGAPALGAYTPMGISQYHRLSHQGNSGDTPVQGSNGQREYLIGISQ